MNKKYLKISILAAIILVVGFMSYLWKSQNISSSRPIDAAVTIPNDWKTYRNEMYGYSIQYPKNWYLESKHANDNFSQRGPEENREIIGGYAHFSNYKDAFSYNVPNPTPEDFLGVGITVYQTDPNMEYQKFKYGHVDSTATSELIEVSGIPAYKIDRVNTDHPVGVKSTTILIKDRDRMFAISYIHNEINREVQKEVFMKMVQSFRLVN